MLSLTGFAKYRDQKLIDPSKHDGRTFLMRTANETEEEFHFSIEKLKESDLLPRTLCRSSCKK